MSRIYFHHPEHEEAQLYGSERAWMGKLTESLGLSVIDDYQFEERIIPKLIDFYDLKHPSYNTGDRFADRQRIWQALQTWLRVGGGCARIGGREIGTTELIANTALVLGNDVIKMLVKLHGCCEDFAYIEPKHCDWAAGIMTQGIIDGLLRPNAGWDDVIRLLDEAATGTEPVVTSYSVCEGFPNSEVANWEPPVCKRCNGNGQAQGDDEADGYLACSACGGERLNYDLWYSLRDDLQWSKAVEGIRTRTHTREIAPETLAFPFMYGETLFDLVETNRSVHDIAPKE
jgi:hypothetical protein